MLVEGPLGRFVDGFAVYLAEQGHSPRSVKGHRAAGQADGRWMATEGIAHVAQLTPPTVERFLRSDAGKVGR